MGVPLGFPVGLGEVLGLIVGSRGVALGSLLRVSGRAKAALRGAGVGKRSGGEAQLKAGLPELSEKVRMHTPGLQSA